MKPTNILPIVAFGVQHQCVSRSMFLLIAVGDFLDY